MRFEKVNKEFFFKDSAKNGFEPTDEIYDAIVMPYRGTAESAGYDFSVPYKLVLNPGEKRTVPTGIKAKMKHGDFLMIVPRSSTGIKKGVVFSNLTCIIDADYHGNKDTDGDIMLALWNTSNKTVTLEKGERVAQGLFLRFGITDDDNATGERKSGIGSTGRM